MDTWDDKKRKNIFIANKESFVSAGELIVKEMKKKRLSLIPIDSEHSAIFSLSSENMKRR